MVAYDERMVTKDEILSEILRLADENGGSPVGRSRFFTETGISESDWLGRYWTRWGDAVAEAGFRPNTLNPVGLSVEDLTASVADLTRDLGHFPTVAERKMKRRSDSGFASHGVIEKRLGNRSELVRRLVEFAADRPGYEAVLDCCTPLMVDDTGGDEVEGEGERAEAGYVYLIRMDRWHKLGCTTDILRRHREIRLTLPEREVLVHTIETDDPFGVERYWHHRFRDRRANGEWFALTPADVRAFRKWRRIA